MRLTTPPPELQTTNTDDTSLRATRTDTDTDRNRAVPTVRAPPSRFPNACRSLHSRLGLVTLFDGRPLRICRNRSSGPCSQVTASRHGRQFVQCGAQHRHEFRPTAQRIFVPRTLAVGHPGSTNRTKPFSIGPSPAAGLPRYPLPARANPSVGARIGATGATMSASQGRTDRHASNLLQTSPTDLSPVPVIPRSGASSASLSNA